MLVGPAGTGKSHMLVALGHAAVDALAYNENAIGDDSVPDPATYAATRLRDRPKPYRLAYRTNVFRHETARLGRMREFYQAGVELLGLDKPEADAEMIAMSIEAFRAAGFERFQIDVMFFYVGSARTEAAYR